MKPTIIPVVLPTFVVDDVPLPSDEFGTSKSVGKSGVPGSTGAGGVVGGGDQYVVPGPLWRGKRIFVRP